MAIGRLMNRPVSLRHDKSDADEITGGRTDDEHSTEAESSAPSETDASQTRSDAESVDASKSPDESSFLKDISFGALAKAQETFAPQSRKRKREDKIKQDHLKPLEGDDISRGNDDREVKKPQLRPPKRTSKHAPVVESTRHAVSRKRTIFEPSPALKARDPRFDPTVLSSNPDRNAAEKANKNYSFLSSYQAAEILDLKSQIKKAKDPDVVAHLKRQVMSIEAKLRSAEARQREKDIMKKHKEKEKEAIKTGHKSKPYYLKTSEVKKLANAERLEGMGKRARDKALARKRKREKSKEARNMPLVRRDR